LFLNIGITLTSFNDEGKTPVSKDKLIILVRMFDISNKTRFSILGGMLQGPLALFVERELMVRIISSVEARGCLGIDDNY